MLDPRTLTHAQLVAIVADVQAILWKESRLLPDFPREYGAYWNPAKEERGPAAAPARLGCKRHPMASI
jgi:hypothetical protein